jgi:hypothetical protein
MSLGNTIGYVLLGLLLAASPFFLLSSGEYTITPALAVYAGGAVVAATGLVQLTDDTPLDSVGGARAVAGGATLVALLGLVGLFIL